MKKSLIIIAFIIAVVLVVVFVFTKTAITPTPTSSTSSEQESTATDSNAALQPSTDTESTATPAATIVVTNDGFNPSNITAKVGDTILIKNESAQKVMFSSDPHPSHTKNSELNQSTISPGSSQTFTVNQKGIFGFHDHLNTRLTGTITVE